MKEDTKKLIHQHWVSHGDKLYLKKQVYILKKERDRILKSGKELLSQIEKYKQKYKRTANLTFDVFMSIKEHEIKILTQMCNDYRSNIYNPVVKLNELIQFCKDAYDGVIIYVPEIKGIDQELFYNQKKSI